ncbi:MAG TPA: hypothetical protein VLF67_02095 [Candidatus Saccharimonas sp.]|nr:hypothetical protein [Candidatus Saccharimonas sp.]
MQPEQTVAIAGTRALIDRIIYLASLASQRTTIDPLMDTLRAVTATWSGEQPLDTSKQASLEALEGKLKTYLVKDDPLRSFTPETLEVRLNRKMSSPDRELSIWSFWGAIGLSSVGAYVAYLVSSDVASSISLSMAVVVFFLISGSATTWYYLTSLRNFKDEMRQVIGLITAGVIVDNLAFAQYVVIQLFELYRYPIFQYAGIPLISGLSYMLVYLGIRKYALLVGYNHPFTRLPVTFGLTAALWVVAVLAPHKAVPDELFFDFSAVGAATLSAFAIYATFLANGIRKRVTSAYAKPMNWMFWCQLTFALGGPAGMVAYFFVGQLYGPTMSLIIASCGIAPVLLLLYTGFSFKRETSG